MRIHFSDAVPAYHGGETAAFYNAGPMLADDQFHTTDEDCPMLLVSKTNEEEFAAYLTQCQAEGFQIIFENHTPAVDAAQLQRGCTLLYAYLTKLVGEVRIIEDRYSSALPAFSEPALSSAASAVVVQYGLYYDPKNQCTDSTVNCGMMYLVRLDDNRLFVIDGGHPYQFSDEAFEGLWAFLHELTDTAPGDPIRIAGWYFTHAHNDHMAACVRLLREHHKELEIQRILYNIPSYQTVSCGYDPDFFLLKKALKTYCPNVPCLKLHCGQTFILGNAEFEILYTHEDAVNPEGRYPFGDFNCTSTILRMRTAGKTVLWLGDTNVEAEKRLCATTVPELWKSDVVQVAHHCFNYLTTLYSWINAGNAMLPNSYFGGHTPENIPKLADVLAHLDAPDHIWYEDKTTAFTFQDGQWQVLFQTDRIGGPHDGGERYGHCCP